MRKPKPGTGTLSAEALADLTRPLKPPLDDPDYWDETEWQYDWTTEKHQECRERTERMLAGDEDAWAGWVHPRRIWPVFSTDQPAPPGGPGEQGHSSKRKQDVEKSERGERERDD
jgi:hypothetical protein